MFFFSYSHVSNLQQRFQTDISKLYFSPCAVYYNYILQPNSDLSLSFIKIPMSTAELPTAHGYCTCAGIRWTLIPGVNSRGRPSQTHVNRGSFALNCYSSMSKPHRVLWTCFCSSTIRLSTCAVPLLHEQP